MKRFMMIALGLVALLCIIDVVGYDDASDPDEKLMCQGRDSKVDIDLTRMN